MTVGITGSVDAIPTEFCVSWLTVSKEPWTCVKVSWLIAVITPTFNLTFWLVAPSWTETTSPTAYPVPPFVTVIIPIDPPETSTIANPLLPSPVTAVNPTFP